MRSSPLACPTHTDQVSGSLLKVFQKHSAVLGDFFVHHKYHSLRIYPYPMVWPLPRPWSETMVSIPLWAEKTLEIKGFLGPERPFLDLVSQAPRPRGRGRPLFAENRLQSKNTDSVEKHPCQARADLCNPNPQSSLSQNTGSATS